MPSKFITRFYILSANFSPIISTYLTIYYSPQNYLSCLCVHWQHVFSLGANSSRHAASEDLSNNFSVIMWLAAGRIPLQKLQLQQILASWCLNVNIRSINATGTRFQVSEKLLTEGATHIFICLLQRFTPSISPRQIMRNERLRTNLVLLRLQGELFSNASCRCPPSVNQVCTPWSRTLKTSTSTAQLTLDFREKK